MSPVYPRYMVGPVRGRGNSVGVGWIPAPRNRTRIMSKLSLGKGNTIRDMVIPYLPSPNEYRSVLANLCNRGVDADVYSSGTGRTPPQFLEKWPPHPVILFGDEPFVPPDLVCHEPDQESVHEVWYTTREGHHESGPDTRVKRKSPYDISLTDEHGHLHKKPRLLSDNHRLLH